MLEHVNVIHKSITGLRHVNCIFFSPALNMPVGLLLSTTSGRENYVPVRILNCNFVH